MTFMASPIGIRVPRCGSSCAVCSFVSPSGTTCVSVDYIKASYRGKVAGDDRFIDGKTGQVVKDPYQFCCNFFDWPGR